MRTAPHTADERDLSIERAGFRLRRRGTAGEYAVKFIAPICSGSRAASGVTSRGVHCGCEPPSEMVSLP